MKDTPYWVIVGKWKCCDGKWHCFKDNLTEFSEFTWRKVFFKETAKEMMRGLLITARKEPMYKAKMGKVANQSIPEDYFRLAAFDYEDYWRKDEYSECIQLRYRGRPAAIFYCIPMYHIPDIYGTR